MLKKVIVSSFIVFAFFSSTLFSDENITDELSGFDDGALLEGFDDGSFSSENSVDENRTKSDNKVVLSGNIAFKTSFGYEKHKVAGVEYYGINQARGELYLQLDSKLDDNWKVRVSADTFYDAIYDLTASRSYRKEILKSYRTQLRFDDTYIQGSIEDNLDAKIGRQIVIWGNSDNIRITDVINPLDNRLPGMTDIEDLRLSVGMAKFDYYVGSWNISTMIIPESRIFLEAPPRSEFFPVDNVFESSSALPDPFPPLVAPSTSWKNMQYALAVNGTFSGWDLSFYAAYVLDQKWHFKQKNEIGKPFSDRTVSRVKMLGTATNIVLGSWLLKAEAAFLNGVKYNTTSDAKNRLDSLIGVEYMGFTDTSISLEISNRHIFDYEKQMKYVSDYVEQDEAQTAIRITRSFLNDRLKATTLVSMFGAKWEYGGFIRHWLEYEIKDALTTDIGVVDYIGGEKPFFESIKDNDRIFADIRYSF